MNSEHTNSEPDYKVDIGAEMAAAFNPTDSRIESTTNAFSATNSTPHPEDEQ